MMATEAPDGPKTRNRAKTESYDVFNATSEEGDYAAIAFDVEVTARGEAERRRLAVSMATLDWPEDRKSGTFATCIAGEFQVMTRKRKVEPVDEWEV